MEIGVSFGLCLLMLMHFGRSATLPSSSLLSYLCRAQVVVTPTTSTKSVSVFVLVLWLSVFEIPLLDFLSSVGDSDSGSSINIITKTRMIHTNFFAL